MKTHLNAHFRLFKTKLRPKNITWKLRLHSNTATTIISRVKQEQ